MKNRVIKKIMAYLLVGAMVISTPMTASANELENAYDSRTTDGERSNTDTGTSTNTSGGYASATVPTVIEKNNINILGLQPDKESLELEVGEKDSLHVRVLLDDYDANDEDLAWANIDAATRAQIEGSIHWISLDPKVATAKVATNAKDEDLNEYVTAARNTDAIIEAKGNGQTKVIAWIEADGIAYANNSNMPTEHDLIAETTVTVKGSKVIITFDEMCFANQKRTYDLQKYTKVDGVYAANASEKVTYSNLTQSTNGKIKATLSDDGKFKITKATTGSLENEEFTFTAVSESGTVKTEKITFTQPVAVKSYTAPTYVGLDYAKETADCNDDKYIANNSAGIATVKLADIVNDGENNSVITDDFIWTSKKKAIVDVKANANGTEATLIANGVGTTDITITTTSNLRNTKKTIKVYVNATPDGFAFTTNEKTVTYTGKPASTKLELKSGNKTLPAEAFTYKWDADRDNKVNAAIKKVGKLNEATITPKNVLNNGNLDNVDVDEKGTYYTTFEYTCGVTYKSYGWDSSRNKVTTTTVNDAKLGNSNSNIKALVGSITIKQSDIADITISEKTLNIIDNRDNVDTEIVGKLPNTKSDTRKTYTNKKYQYMAQAYAINGLKTVRDENQDDAIAWSVNGKAATIGANGYFTPVSAGKTNITASYISLKYKNGKATAQVKKKTVPVQIIQNATAISFQKPVQVVQPNTTKGQTVTVKISNVTPKKATYNITSWKVIAYGNDGAGVSDLTVIEDGIRNYKKNDVITLDAKDKNGNFRKDAKIGIPANIKAGTVIKVAAYTDGGVVATGYIYVTSKLEVNKPGDLTATVGTTLKADAAGGINKAVQINGKDAQAWIEGKKDANGKPLTYDGREAVTYSVPKASAKFVRVDRNGNIIPLQSTNGKKVTITVQTLSGKKINVKVEVKNPS